MNGPDELDLALLDALHTNPRATFDDLGRVLGISGPTVARRWRKLATAGLAWVSSAFGPAMSLVGGLLLAECEPGAAPSVAKQLASVPQVFSVHITTGRYNVYALVLAADDMRLAHLLVDALPRTVGIRAVETASVVHLFSGVDWRLGAISAAQTKEVAKPAGPSVPRQFDDFDRQIYLALQSDGRMSYRDLAANVGTTELVARRRTQLLVRSQTLTFRTDFARAAAGWPISVVLLLRVDADVAVADVGRELAAWPEIRVCAAVLGGDAQLFVTVQVHHLSAMEGIFSRLREACPGLVVLTSRVVQRPVKSYGRLLTTDGFAAGIVPVDPWADPPSDYKLQDPS
ncbi:Lrp/AsnC family transcriptional regulator [Mycobacterium sp. 1081908.1]|uniref:Lrp/AsnC family transcriptional regulator n=1 Tax=Mycobacterium sp. 1081908.1 TaxID=1834066 RepID=UPI0018D43F5D|nr:Lrp/AsnC family transcriptional regulator [Mycobacterium sp. 1081908.1]